MASVAASLSKYSLVHPRSYQEALAILKGRTDYLNISKAKAAIWNRLASHFDNPLTQYKAIHLAKTIGRLSKLSTAKHVLETASGVGYAASSVYSSLLPEDGRIVVTDFAETYTNMWKTNHRDPKITYELAEAMALKYKDETFDRYICCSGITQFVRPDIAFEEAYRVLKPGGYFVVNMPKSCSYEETVFVPSRHYELVPHDPDELLCTIEDPRFLIELCEKAGFRNVLVFEDIVTIDLNPHEFTEHIELLLGPAVNRATPEVQKAWREKTHEVIEYFLTERKEFINYRTIGVRAIKPQ